MTVPAKSQLKRKITPPKSEPFTKSIKISDEIKLNTLKKADLVKFCEELIEKNENLVQENKKLLDSEKELLKIKETLEENAKESKKNMYFCGECDYVADCFHDFNDHTHNPEDVDNIETSSFSFKFCDDCFRTMSEVMRHSKFVHTSSVQHCENYLKNSCLYGDNCWFLHCESFRSSEPSIKCNFCEQKCRTKNAVREHIKKFHMEKVSKCKSEDECKFGPKKCWFIHKEDIEILYQNAISQSQI